MEYEEKVKKEEEYKLQSKAERDKFLAQDPSKGFSPVYAQTAHNLMNSISSRNNYRNIMRPLKHLSLPIGASLHVEKCKNEWPGDQSKLFVKTFRGTHDYEI